MAMSGFVTVAVIVAALLIYLDYRRRFPVYKSPDNITPLLLAHVEFYKELDDVHRGEFEARVKDFLTRTSVRGVNVEVDDLDRVLVAAGAIMLIFSFPGWRYNNISEVLLYDGPFNKSYETYKPDSNMLGLVGEGIMNRRMLLSKPAVLESFQKPIDGRNTVVHEFAHLIDKADGEIDGIPAYLLTRPEVLPWMKKIHESIMSMRSGGMNDINFYGATNPPEFFAVISEYFFERPDKLREHHPELYAMLAQMFQGSRA